MGCLGSIVDIGLYCLVPALEVARAGAGTEHCSPESASGTMKSAAGIGGCYLGAVSAAEETSGNGCYCFEIEVAAAAADIGCHRIVPAIGTVVKLASSEPVAGEETLVVAAEAATVDIAEEVAKLEAPMRDAGSAVAAEQMSEEVEVYIEAAVPEEEAAVATGQVESRIFGVFGRTAVVVVALPAEGRQEQEEAGSASVVVVGAEPVWPAEERLLWRQFFQGGSAQDHHYCPGGSCLHAPWLAPMCSPFHQS